MNKIKKTGRTVPDLDQKEERAGKKEQKSTNKGKQIKTKQTKTIKNSEIKPTESHLVAKLSFDIC